MKNLQTKTGNKNEENQIIQSLIEKISLKEKLEEERMAKINDLTNQIKELKNKIPLQEPKPVPVPEPKPVSNTHDNSPPPPPQYILYFFILPPFLPLL